MLPRGLAPLRFTVPAETSQTGAEQARETAGVAHVIADPTDGVGGLPASEVRNAVEVAPNVNACGACAGDR